MSEPMNILVAGDWHSELHEEAVASALEQAGHSVARFAWHGYFELAGKPIWQQLWLKAQNKYLCGSVVNRLNRDLLDTAYRTKPDVVFIYRGTHIYAKTLRALKAMLPHAVLVGYNNDDPFAPGHVPGLWRHFNAGLKELDLALAYRYANLEDFRRVGAPRVELLRSWYIPQRNHPLTLTPQQQAAFDCDVVFIGHYEPDMRLDCIAAAVNAGYRVRIFGPDYEWEPVLRQHPALSQLLPVRLVWGSEYNLALCGAKIALAFLSKLNRDTYTRRNFEIPASGVLMLSEYTADLASLFQPGVEADYFANPEELLSRLHAYLHDDDKRLRIAAAGHRKVKQAGHDVGSRMNMMMDWVQQVIKNKEKL